MKSWNRDEIEGQSHQVSAGPLDLSFLAALPATPEPFADGRQIPGLDLSYPDHGSSFGHGQLPRHVAIA